MRERHVGGRKTGRDSNRNNSTNLDMSISTKKKHATYMCGVTQAHKHSDTDTYI